MVLADDVLPGLVGFGGLAVLPGCPKTVPEVDAVVAKEASWS
jgi:hypothetical protein